MKFINFFYFLFIFIFLLLKPDNKFEKYIAAEIEKQITEHFKEKQHMAIETDDKTEQRLFIKSYEEKIKKQQNLDYLDLVYFKTYNEEKNDWEKEPGEISLNFKILQTLLENKKPVLVILEKADKLGEQEKINFIRDFLLFKKEFDNLSIPFYILIQIKTIKNINKKILKAKLIDISYLYHLEEKEKIALFETMLKQIEHLLEFQPKKVNYISLLSTIKTTNLLTFFEHIWQDNKRINEIFFYKNLFMQAFKEDNLQDNLNLENNKIEKERTAVHEVGHALMQYILEKKIAFTSILPGYVLDNFTNTNITFSGYTAYGESKEELKNKMKNAAFFYNKIDCALAGIITENEFFNIISTQGFEDQKDATTLAANLIKDGLGKKLKVVPAEQNPTFYQEIDELLEESKVRTTKIIKENKELITILAKKLEEKEILFGDEFAEIVENYKSKQ